MADHGDLAFDRVVDQDVAAGNLRHRLQEVANLNLLELRLEASLGLGLREEARSGRREKDRANQGGCKDDSCSSGESIHVYFRAEKFPVHVIGPSALENRIRIGAFSMNLKNLRKKFPTAWHPANAT